MHFDLDQVRDNPYVPPVAITSFKVFNEAVPIGGEVLKQSISYVDSLILPYRDNVSSFEFAALSYVNSHRNRYRYRLENFDANWTELGSKGRRRLCGVSGALLDVTAVRLPDAGPI